MSGVLVGTAAIVSADEMRAFGGILGSVLEAGDAVVLTGPLGAGKTTLVRGLGATLRVRGTVQSPTFVIARTHPPLEGGPALVHVDAYRLGSAVELDDLDLDLDASVTVVEWGSEVIDAIADSWLELVIERATGADAADGAGASVGATGDAGAAADAGLDPDAQHDEPRTITLRAIGPRWLDANGAPRPELAALLA